MHPRTQGPGRKSDFDLRRSVYEITKLRMSGRISEMMQFFASDVVIHYHCAVEGLFLAGVLQGAGAFRENIRLTDAEYEPIDSEVLDLLIEGERSVIRWRNSWRNRGTGYTRTLDMAHFMHWENGQVVEMFEYLDYHGMLALACN
jgi:hypothetical protein